MSERLVVKVAVFDIFRKNGMLLMLLRRNTGYMDDFYTLPSGHVERGEFPSGASDREGREETGLAILEKDSDPVHIMYRKQEGDHTPYVDFYFEITMFEGEPYISSTEQDKCAELTWFPEDLLPEKTIPYVTLALTNIAKGIRYSEVTEE